MTYCATVLYCGITVVTAECCALTADYLQIAVQCCTSTVERCAATALTAVCSTLNCFISPIASDSSDAGDFW